MEENTTLSTDEENLEDSLEKKEELPKSLEEENSLSRCAKLFGQSKEELEQDFKNYKAKLLLKKIDYNLLIDGLTREELKAKCTDTVQAGFNGVMVFPSYVKDCKEFLRLSGLKVSSILGYQNSEQQEKVILYSLKKLILTGIDEIFICLPLSVIRSGNIAYVKRLLKSIKRRSKNKKVVISFQVDKLNSVEIDRVVEEIVKMKFYGIAMVGSGSDKTELYYKLKTIKSQAENTLQIITIGNFSQVEEVVSNLELSDRVVLYSALDISQKLNVKINF